MIVVRVELWSAVTGERQELARAVIDNVGGTVKKRDYRVRTLRGRDKQALDKSLIELGRGGKPTREGKVIGHASLSLDVWHLVAKALTAMGYGS